MRHRPMLPVLAGLLLPLLVGACGSAERLSRVGRPPALSPIENPAADPHWRPVAMPMPSPQPPLLAENSLWRPGSRTFLRDQRAAQVGDLLTVLVSIQDEAQLQNRTQATRNANQQMGAPALLGLEASTNRILPPTVNPANLLNTTGTATANGQGEVRRNESITLRIAATVTQVLPNGNLVIMGRQEVRVNAELRELSVAGVVRPQDIASDNTVRHDRLAEARIAYGGRGTLSDVQQPRYGQQILDALLPF
ncbi:MAG: flagellar basal body L-ring protein FlgH [Rhodovarius sp.]|nr:flagellar basal body L-ring protein FlgH [Rhodovarius sp.]MCX7933041.1 flagellar basal body L-ring protein FlgH [Rhodovarius sp.]MDW8314243.1 flagellar basal body L-ring protein FlgH [Rhodovarius sp.]